jgi:arginase
MKYIKFHTKFTFDSHNDGKDQEFHGEDKNLRQWHIIGVGSGWGARDMGTADGPKVLVANAPNHFQILHKSMTYWHHTPVNIPHKVALSLIEAEIHANHVLEVVTHVCEQVKNTLQRGEFPLILGGDHSIAIGTWSGVKAAMEHEDMGLIWVDAHLDAHTFQTSPSHNIHGMPIAVLLGEGEPRFTTLGTSFPKVKPENLCLIGIRSFEPGEENLLSRLGVKVYLMEEVHTRGFATVFEEARRHIRARRFGLSIDVDAFDPKEAPGTGTPENLGLHLKDVRGVLQGLAKDSDLLALEITEFNPHQDVHHKTCELVWGLATFIKGDIS